MKAFFTALTLALSLSGAASSAVADDRVSLQVGDDAVVRVDHAAVMAGEQRIAELGAGRQIRIERTQGDWLLTTVPQNGALLRGWVHQRDVARLSLPAAAQRRYSYEPGLGGNDLAPMMGVRRRSNRTSGVPLYALPKGDGRRWSNGQ